MKEVLKSVAIGVVTSLVVSAILGMRKIKDVEKIIKNLKIKLTRINSINPLQGQLNINVDLALQNNSDIDINIDTSSLISLKKILFYNNNGVLLGEVIKEVNNIVLGPNGSFIIEDVNLKITTNNVFALAQQILTANAGNIQVRAHLEIFGNPYTI